MNTCIVCTDPIDPTQHGRERCYECGCTFHVSECGKYETAGWWSSWTPAGEMFCNLCLDNDKVQTRLKMVRKGKRSYREVGIDRSDRRERIQEDQS